MLFYLQHSFVKRSLAILCVATVFLIAFSGNATQQCQTHNKHYNIIGYFHSVKGVQVGTEVRLSGTNIGHVCALHLQDDFMVKATMQLNSNIELPTDSAFLIVTNGINQQRFVKVSLGGSFDVFAHNDEALYTQSAIDTVRILEVILKTAEPKFRKKYMI